MDNADGKRAQRIDARRPVTGGDERSAAVEALNAHIETTRSDSGLHQDHVAALIRLGNLELKLGRLPEAERLLTEAIAVGDRHLGAEHASLGAALNELSRLHLKQSDYSRAEPVLERLLQIARAKGERHPDVATALAGLAVAKRGLGDETSAEMLYRRALRIREDVLPPEHMAIVVTLEQLAETCAARGNFAEALVHLERALLRRERALGAEHATVHGLHERIAELKRRHSQSVAAAGRLTPVAAVAVVQPPIAPPALVETPAAISATSTRTTDRRATPARSRSVATVATQAKRTGELAFLYQPEPTTTRPARPTLERALTPIRTIAVGSATSEFAELSALTPTVTLARTTSSTESAALAPRRSYAMSPVLAIAAAPVFGASPPDISSLIWSIKRTTRFASAGAAAAVLAMAGFDFGVAAGRESEYTPTPPSVRRAAVVTPASNPVPPTTFAVAATAATPIPSSATPIPAAKKPAPADETPAAKSTTPVALPSFRRLVVPQVAMPSVDSLVRAAAKVARDVDSEPIAAGSSLLTPAANADASVKPPVLVYAPALRFPDELRSHRVEGEVVVQFRVNEKGRVEASTMRVLQSEHELLTAAVRNVLPRFRFEPARSAPDAKPQSALVQFRAQFRARN